MIYENTSIQEVLGRVVRDTGLQQSEYLADMPEWIGAAMGMMKTRQTLQLCWKPVEIHFHKGRMPCGTVSLVGVECSGERLQHFSGSRAFDAPRSSVPPSKEVTVFGSVFTGVLTPTGGTISETELLALNNLPFSGTGYYYTEPGWINTSLNSGCVIAHYRRLPLDAAGYPLIPDNENYKEALYWFCRTKMIGTGWKDAVFNYEQCEARWDRHKNLAVNEITYPSVDQVDSWLQNQTRLLFPEGWANAFFEPLKPEGPF